MLPFGLSFASVFMALTGIVFLLNKDKRESGKLLLRLSVATLVGAIFSASHVMDKEAKRAGFESHAEKTPAASHNITDPAIWLEKQAELQAEEEQPASAEEQEERRKGFHCLSAWDGSHRAFRDEIQNLLRDPKSFEHVETKVTPVSAAGTHQLYMEYRARNRFGGMKAGLATEEL